MADFAKLGAQVVGISGDDPATLVKFQKETESPQQFVSDGGLKISQAYGVKQTEQGESFAQRQTFVISKDGKILYSVLDWSPLTNVNSVYAWLKEHPQN